MRILALAALASAVAAAPSVSAEAPGVTDQPCGFASITDPDPEKADNTQTGEIDGGPVLQGGTLTCTIQVGGALHVDPDNGASASATGTDGVTVLPPTPMSYVAAPNEYVYLCDAFTDDAGVTYVYDDVDGAWENAVGNTAATCRLVISPSTEDPIVPPLPNDMVCFTLSAAGPAGVPGVVTLGSDGDVDVLGGEFWLCPPYEA